MKVALTSMDEFFSFIMIALAFAFSMYMLSPDEMASNKEANDFVAAMIADADKGKRITQQQALYEVWGLTQEDAEKPINIFAEK